MSEQDTSQTLARLRREYGDRGLDLADLADDPVGMFRALARRDRRVGAARAERDGGHLGVRRRPALVADGAAQGPRRARVRVLHQPRVPQGARDRGQPARLAAVPVAGPAAPGPRRGHGVAGLRGGERGVLRLPAARVPARGLGVAAVARGGLALRPRRAVRRRAGAVRRAGRRTAAAVLGRAARRAGDGGVLAGPQGPDARPAGLPPRRRRPQRALDGRPPRPLLRSDIGENICE